MAKMIVTKQVPLSKKILEMANARTDQVGMNFPEYVRMLIVQDYESSEEVEYLTPQEEKAVAEGMDDIKHGRYTTLKTDKEIEDYFKKLSEEVDKENV